MVLKQIVIVSPALSDANNGNWQTAKRWAHLLAPYYRTRIVKAWPDAAASSDDTMLALHALRSAPAIAAWHAQRGSTGLAVALTGTDLYRDIQSNPVAQQSLALAGQLVVLQALGLDELPAGYRAKTAVVLQSTTARKALAKTSRHLNALMVGHLRNEKSPQTLFVAARALAQRSDIHIAHIGAGLDPALAREAAATAAQCPHYSWLGGLPHANTRSRIQRAHVLVHPSLMEGGAHVVMEAVCSGTPVLASGIAGNVGMLGADYAGYFPAGDAAALALLLLRARDDAGFLDQLKRQCAARAPLFTAQAETQALLAALTF